MAMTKALDFVVGGGSEQLRQDLLTFSSATREPLIIYF
jgi:hypothetical protein